LLRKKFYFVHDELERVFGKTLMIIPETAKRTLLNLTFCKPGYLLDSLYCSGLTLFPAPNSPQTQRLVECGDFVPKATSSFLRSLPKCFSLRAEASYKNIEDFFDHQNAEVCYATVPPYTGLPIMEPGEINDVLAVHEQSKNDTAEEVEKIDDLDASKAGGDAFTPEEERRLVRKLDFWYLTICKHSN
jgi:hypothetical protein